MRPPDTIGETQGGERVAVFILGIVYVYDAGARDHIPVSSINIYIYIYME